MQTDAFRTEGHGSSATIRAAEYVRMSTEHQQYSTENQARAQQKWLDVHPGYWQRYRTEHPAYAQRNRELQRGRNAARAETSIAKMGVSTPLSPLPSGTYRLTRELTDEIAKMDAWIVKITLLSGT